METLESTIGPEHQAEFEAALTETKRFSGLVEGLTRELRPGALALGGDVPDALRPVEELARRLGEVADVRRTADLVVDDPHLVALTTEVQHRPHEVLARPAEEPGAADDPAVADLALTGELRPAVDRKRARLVRLEVRLAFAPVEDVVGRVVDDGHPERGDVARPHHVHSLRAGRVKVSTVTGLPCDLGEDLQVDRTTCVRDAHRFVRIR